MGIGACLGSAAVGSLREDWQTGTLVACSDFLDFSGRNLTLFEDTVSHTDFTHPFDQLAHRAIVGAAESVAIPKGTYVNANGPRYESPAEIAFYKGAGGDVVGMTAGSEAIAMREAGVGYACLAIVTNLAAGLGASELTHAEVEGAMRASGEVAARILLAAAEDLGARV
jgi:5'-methylthioadenosine phosphorylase